MPLARRLHSPGMTSFRHFTIAATLLSIALTLATNARADSTGTAIIYDAPWSPGDAPRSGAAEFTVLLSVARLRHDHTRAGIVAVGNQNGLLQPATEDALTRAALMGVAVVRLSGSAHAPALPDDLFIAAPSQPALIVEKILSDCLVRFGAPPAAVNPAKPTARETAAIRRVISRYQMAFDTIAFLARTHIGTLATGPRNDHES